MTMAIAYMPLFGEADGYDGAGYDSGGYDREGYNSDGYNADGYDSGGCDRDGNPRNVPAADLDLSALWDEYDSYSESGFRAYLREITSEPEAISDVVFCISCGHPAWESDTSAARGVGTDHLCESCYDDWSTCYRCEDAYPGGELTETLGGDNVCGPCLSGNYSHCEDCDGYYRDENADEHDHEDEEDSSRGCCEAPQQKFSIRNDGCEPLANDTRVMVTLAAGIVSAAGLRQIREYLLSQRFNLLSSEDRQRMYNLAYDLESLGDLWQAKEGNYPKRLSRHAYKNHELKLPLEILSQVGCTARDNSGSQDSYAVEVTRDLNQSAYAFGHGDSCWWQSYGYSRCALKSNGGFALRSFARGNVSGRAWVMPLRDTGRLTGAGLRPTFDTETPDAFVVFNGYGELGGYTAARVLAHMAGMTYRKIGFSCEPMYVNAGGYLIAPEEIAGKYTDGALNLYVDKHADLFDREQAAKETPHAGA